MIAIMEAYKAGLLKPNNWKSNIIAGMIVGVIALPLSMAFAIASGVKPEQGIYTAIIAGFIVGVFGGTRVQISGPTGAFVVVIASIVAHYGVVGLQVATIMAGLILLIMGFLKLGTMIKFVPYPVIVGFTSGIGMIIFVGQWKDFFGLPVHIPIEMNFYEKISLLLNALPHLDMKTTALSCLSLLILIFSPRYIKNLPSPLLAMIIATIIQYIINDPQIATIGSVFGEIPHDFPEFSSPDLTHVNIINLIIPAITIAFLGSVESLLSAAATDSVVGKKHNANIELMGQGLANVIAPFWGGFASTGAIARTVANISHGGNSPIGAIVHSIVLILIIFVFTPYIIYVPFATLSTILFVVAFNMSDIPAFIHILQRAPWYDICILLTTFMLTILTDLVIAVIGGFLIAILFIFLRVYQTHDMKKNIFKNFIEKLTAINITHLLSGEGIIYIINGPFFFIVSDQIENAILKIHTEYCSEPSYVVFCLKNVHFMDLTGLKALSNIIKKYHKHNIKVYVCEANDKVSQKVLKSGILKMVYDNKIFDSLDEISLGKLAK